jgi:multiple sugar transport system substrate-binding protein
VARITPCIVACALAAVLIACGDAERTTPGAHLTGSITVSAAGGEGEIKALQSVADAFMGAHPGTTVVLDTVAVAGELISKLTAAFLANRPPDVFVLNYRRLGGIAARDVIDPVAGVDTASLYAKPLTAFTFGGTLLCLPSNASSMVVYYNPSLFARAGVDTPKTGWSWDDMLSTARALRAKGVSAIGFETALIRLAPFVWSNGGEFFDDLEDPTSVDLSSAKAREAIRFLLDLQETGQSATDRAAQDPESAFSAGKIAMYLDSRRAVPGFRNTEGLTFDVAPVPIKETPTSVLHSDGYCVTKASKNKSLARAFAGYVVTGDGARVLAESGRSVPMSPSLAASDSFIAPGEAPAHSRVFIDQLARVRPLPHGPAWNEAEGFVEEVLTQLFARKLTLDEAISKIAEGTKRELAKA